MYSTVVPKCSHESGSQHMDAGVSASASGVASTSSCACASCSCTERTGQTEHELLEKRDTREPRANCLGAVRAHLQESAHTAHEVGHLSQKLLQARARSNLLLLSLPIGLWASHCGWGCRSSRRVELNFDCIGCAISCSKQKDWVTVNVLQYSCINTHNRV